MKKERQTQYFGVSGNNDKRSCPEVFYRGGALKDLAKFTGK